MKIKIPKEESFLAPAGIHQAICTAVREFEQKTKNGMRPVIRLVFEIISIQDEAVTYKAGKNYYQDKLDDLTDDLAIWLGKSVRGKELELKDLVGEAATIEIVIIENEEYPEPYRNLESIRPPQQPPPAKAREKVKASTSSAQSRSSKGLRLNTHVPKESMLEDLASADFDTYMKRMQEMIAHGAALDPNPRYKTLLEQSRNETKTPPPTG